MSFVLHKFISTSSPYQQKCEYAPEAKRVIRNDIGENENRILCLNHNQTNLQVSLLLFEIHRRAIIQMPTLQESPFQILYWVIDCQINSFCCFSFVVLFFLKSFCVPFFKEGRKLKKIQQKVVEWIFDLCECFTQLQRDEFQQAYKTFRSRKGNFNLENGKWIWRRK